MSDFIDFRLEPGLWLGVDWSWRWALLIVLAAAWFAVRAPRSAAVRLAVCQLTLVAGLALPLVPHWWTGRFLPARTSADVTQAAFGLSSAESGHQSAERAEAEPGVAPTTASPRHVASPSGVRPQAEVSRPRELPSRPLVPAAEPFGLWRMTVLVAAGLWAAGAGVQLLRLLAAAIGLKLLCRGTTLPARGSQEAFDRCRQEMRLRRTVRLGIHPGVSAPLVVGGWRSTVLVPADWDGLAPEAQRAILWHELAHLARFDDLARVGEEFVRALFFFHPCVHWLLNRIDGYREEVCDASVLRRGVAAPTLAEILVDFSRRHSAARHAASVKPALPFFHRRSVKRRIAELMEEETVVRWSAPLAGRQIAYLGLLAAAALAGLGSFGLEAADSPASGPAPAVKNVETQTAGSKTAAESSTLKRILANWQARQDRTKSLHLAWDSQIPPNEGSAESQQLMQALIAVQRATIEVRALSRAVEEHLPMRRGDGSGAPKVAKEELAKAKARLAAAQAAYRLAGEKTANPKSPHAPFRVLHNELWIEGDKRIRVEQSFTHGRGYRYVRDGMTQSTLAWRSDSSERPLAKIWSGEGRPEFQAIDLGIDFGLQDLLLTTTTPRPRTPWMIFRPFDPESWRPEDFRLVAEDAVVNNAHYVKIARTPTEMQEHETYFVDPARNDVIVFEDEFPAEMRFADGMIHRTQMFGLAIEYQRDRDGGWLPVRWNLNTSQKVNPLTSFNTVTGLAINETFPPETFALNFAPGTVVFDRRTREQYVVPEKGFKTIPWKFDSDKSLRIREILESWTDFTIEPQLLKDALDFIATRYQIAIRIDEKAFEQNSIDTSAEVACNESGIKVGELLTRLLKTFGRPKEFKIENGVLVIEPPGHAHWFRTPRAKAAPAKNQQKPTK